MILRYIPLLSLLIFAGCGDQKPTNLSVAKKAIEAYYESSKFNHEVTHVIEKALRHFERLGHAADCEAVIFDIDDTVLSNYRDMKKIHFGYVPNLYHQWVLRADAPALDEVRPLYDFLLAHGYHIIFLTGRRHDEYDATVKNLKLRGFHEYTCLIVRTQDEEMLTAREFKTAQRKRLVEAGYHIVGSVGDQWSDLLGGNTGYMVKIPNYTYVID